MRDADKFTFILPSWNLSVCLFVSG